MFSTLHVAKKIGKSEKCLTGHPRFPGQAHAHAAAWLKSFGVSVWHEYSPMAVKYGAVNLGQGFPNWSPPAFLLRASHQAIDGATPNLTPAMGSVIHQYSRPAGHLRLVSALSALYSPLIGRNVDPMTEIQVVAGASDGLFTAVLALVDPGDEVIVFAPYYDLYEVFLSHCLGAIAAAGAKLVQVDMTIPSDATDSSAYTIDVEVFKKAITPRTKAVIINNPHNPTGKVFSRAELQAISKTLLSSSDRAVLISDEVYEFMTYEEENEEPFTRMCTIEGMWDRTVTVSSASKTFSVTGWKVGWVYGPKSLIDPVQRAHQFITFCIATPLQEAVAVALEQMESENYISKMRLDYRRKRALLLDVLRNAGFQPVVPQGSFFVMCSVADRSLSPGQGQDSSITRQFLVSFDWNYCRWLTSEIGVAAIPCSAFFSDQGNGRPTSWIRFAFCKNDAEIVEAGKRLLKLTSLSRDE